MRRTRSPKPGSPEWNAERRRAIFATDAAATAGLSRFSDPHTLYMEKLGLTAPKLTLERMVWGQLLEKTIAAEWARRKGVKVKPAGQWTYWRDDLPFPMAAHLDYWIAGEQDEILEVKTASAYSSGEYGEQDTDEVPIDYRLQIVHQMAVTGAPRAHLAVLLGGNDLRTYVVQRDLDLEASLLQIEERFWGYVTTRTPPEFDGSEGASEYIRTQLAVDNGEQVELDEDAAALAVALIAAREAKRASEQQEKDLANKVKSRLGEASGARGHGVTITFRQNRDTPKTDWETVANELALYAVGLGGSLGQRDEAVAANTTLVPGARPLVVKYDAA